MDFGSRPRMVRIGAIWGHEGDPLSQLSIQVPIPSGSRCPNARHLPESRVTISSCYLEKLGPPHILFVTITIVLASGLFCLLLSLLFGLLCTTCFGTWPL